MNKNHGRTALVMGVLLAGGFLVAAGHASAWTALDPLGCNDVAQTGSRSVTATTESSTKQSVSLDQTDVLLGIALARNGFGGVTLGALTDGTATQRDAASLQQSGSLDRNSVFAELALGGGRSGFGTGLGCIANVNADVSRTATVTNNVGLDENNVFDALALHNALGWGMNFGDVANIDRTTSTQLVNNRDVSLDPNQALLLVALGGGR